jgi:hypothetical protein
LNRVGKMAAVAALIATLVAAPSGAVDDQEVYQDPIHSDVPPWGAGPDVWPQHFTDGEDFG